MIRRFLPSVISFLFQCVPVCSSGTRLLLFEALLLLVSRQATTFRCCELSLAESLFVTSAERGEISIRTRLSPSSGSRTDSDALSVESRPTESTATVCFAEFCFYEFPMSFRLVCDFFHVIESGAGCSADWSAPTNFLPVPSKLVARFLVHSLVWSVGRSVARWQRIASIIMASATRQLPYVVG